MPISNEEYESALNVVATRDKDTLSDTQEALLPLIECARDSLTTIAEIRESLPLITGSSSSARTNFESIFNQLQGLTQQLTYLQNTVSAQLTQYEGPIVTPTGPSTTTL